LYDGEHSDTMHSRTEITGMFWNVPLDKDGEYHWGRSWEKWRSVTYSQERGKHSTDNKKG
jgi:hypothetical protein